jgi:hypothetical protein
MKKYEKMPATKKYEIYDGTGVPFCLLPGVMLRSGEMLWPGP